MNNRVNSSNSLELTLNHYFQILSKKELSNSKKASLIPVAEQRDLRGMWREHENIRMNHPGLIDFNPEYNSSKPSFSYLDLKIEIAKNLFHKCVFCQRRCEINRNNEIGICGVQDPKIASEFLHMGEETPLVPSHTIFFTGCTFKCVYCQNWDISQHPEDGMTISVQRMSEIIDRRRSEGSRNVNFVGGDPNPQLLYILKTVSLIHENLPVIWNSNFYMSPEAMQLLDGVIDLYLTDFKYGNNNCAMRLSGVPDYWEVVTHNHKLAYKSGDMIIRHLVLPNHLECCTKPILDWIYDNLGKEVVINIMGQYRPVYGACAYDDISRFVQNREMVEVMQYAQDLGFKNLI